MDLFGRMTTFVRVVEAGSLSAAAKQLRISIPSVSRHITAIEEEVGTSLLSRTTRRVVVTPAGQRYYERCIRVLREVEEAREVGRLDIDGTIRISLPIAVGIIAGEALMRDLLEKHAGLRLEMRLEDRLVDLVLEDVDIAVRVGAKPPLSTELVARPLSRWSRVVVASPGWVRAHGDPKTPAALAKHAALTSAGSSSEVWSLDNGKEQARVRMNVRCASNAGHLLLQMTREGFGVALLPDWYVAADLRKKTLKRILPNWSAEPTEVYALYRASHRNEPRVRRAVEALQSVYAKIEQTLGT